MHKYATRLLPASSVWKPNHTSPPNAWWVLNHWWPNKAASSHQIRYLHRKTRQNINEETFPVWSCRSKKIFKKQDYGRIFPILSNGPNGDISYFIQLFSKYIPRVLWNWLDLMLFCCRRRSVRRTTWRSASSSTGRPRRTSPSTSAAPPSSRTATSMGRRWLLLLQWLSISTTKSLFFTDL